MEADYIQSLKDKYITKDNSKEVDDYEKWQREDEAKAVKLVLTGIMDDKYIEATMSDFQVLPENQRTFNEINTWLANYTQGRWIVLKGNQGTGKTMMKNIIIREMYTRHKIRCYSTTHYGLFTEYLDSIKNGGNSALLETLGRKKMLIVDELGRRKHTEAFSDFMFELFDRIYLNKGSALLITNSESVKDYIDLSRLTEVGTALTLTGKDFRRTK